MGRVGSTKDYRVLGITCVCKRSRDVSVCQSGQPCLSFEKRTKRRWSVPSAR